MTRSKIDMTQARYLRLTRGFTVAGIARQMGITALEARDAVDIIDAELEVKKPRQWSSGPKQASRSAAPSPAAGSTKESRRGPAS